MIGRRGATLIMTIILLLLLSLFSLMIFHVSQSEIQMAGAQKNDVQAFYLAEAGMQLVNYWFHHPGNFQDKGNFFRDYPDREADKFFLKRSIDAYGARAFVDASGKSQFSGTREQPDLAYDATESNDDRFLNHPDQGILRNLHGRGRLVRLKVYRPTMPGSLCTVEATGVTNSGAKRTVAAEFMAAPVPALTAAVQLDDSMVERLPILIHWGDVKTRGNGDLGKSLSAIPVKDPAALPYGVPYSMTERNDGWLDFYIGDEIVSPLPKDCDDCSEPYLSTGQGNIHQRHPLVFDRWDYTIYKALSKAYGFYYSTDAEGRLFLDGIQDAEHQRSAQNVFTAGNYQRFIFIDTLDGNPPASNNLATLTVEAGDLSGIVYLNANLKLIQTGSGRAVQAKPPPPFSETLVTLDNIHFRGAFYSPGSLYIEGHPMMFGAVSFGKGITGPGQLEIWYDDELRSGYLPGYPVVSMASGSWRELDE